MAETAVKGRVSVDPPTHLSGPRANARLKAVLARTLPRDPHARTRVILTPRAVLSVMLRLAHATKVSGLAVLRANRLRGVCTISNLQAPVAARASRAHPKGTVAVRWVASCRSRSDTAETAVPCQRPQFCYSFDTEQCDLYRTVECLACEVGYVLRDGQCFRTTSVSAPCLV